MFNEDEFKRLIKIIIETYQLSPDTANDLLQRILSILSSTKIQQ